MRYIYILLAFISLESKAQTIQSLYDDEYGAIDGAYYKDTHNDFDNYTGTWKYTNGSTSLTITLQKKIMVPYYYGPTNIYEDVIIGEYKYVEDGYEKINTLSQLLSDLPKKFDYNIAGNTIIAPGTGYCFDCGPNDRKLLLSFSDPTRHIEGFDPEMIFQRADSGGVQKLKLVFRTTSGGWYEEGTTPEYTSYTIPFGEYLLVKQP